MYGLAARAVRISRRRPDLPLPAAAGGALPRRHAADRARRRLLAHHAEGEGPSDHHAAAARLRRRRGDRRRDRGRALRAEARARRAAVRRRRCRSSRAPITPTQPFDEIDARRRRSAPAPTRSAASRPAAIIEYERVKDWWGADLPVARGQNNFDVVRYEYLSRPRRRLRRLHRPRTICSARNSPRASGRRATISRRSRTAASSATCCPTTRRPARRAGSSTRGARSSRTRSCARR